VSIKREDLHQIHPADMALQDIPDPQRLELVPERPALVLSALFSML
jgi:hypothetical protein